jgi:DNA repair protein RecN (Recombination protein N)
VTGDKVTGQQSPNHPITQSPNHPAIRHQVLCITHLPQLAAFGDQHFTVNKRIVTAEGEERTRTVVQALAGEARLEELAQMLGTVGEAGRRSVEEMMNEVVKVKQNGLLLR